MLGRYWPEDDGPIRGLPIVRASESAEVPPRLTAIVLPEWGSSAAVQGEILVPSHVVSRGGGEPWTRVDWIEAAAWYLNGTAERKHEAARGPIHSYAFRLAGWDSRMWDHAWANRIALWLRLWAERQDGRGEGRSLGALPNPQILLTHDVDAVTKTIATRVKQSAFHSLNAARHLAGGRLGRAGGRVRTAARFALGSSNYWRIPEVRRLEDERGWRSVFNFFAGPTIAGRTLKRRLMDPAYDPTTPPVAHELPRLLDGGWAVGRHPSFDSWEDAARITREREALSRAAGHSITSCRQHWLRFSWSGTWIAQSAAGITLDTTLGFNDRSGFRNGAALAFRPLEDAPLVSLPMVVMDSHLYDYHPMTDEERDDELDRWLGEIREVRGQASLVWHQRVLSPDYGWDYRRLLEAVARNGLEVVPPQADGFT